jgi:hypothetical protein
MGAPVCLITPKNPYAPPNAAMASTIPIASDLASAIQAINAMRLLLQQLMNQIPANNTTPGGGFKSSPSPNKPNANFNEVQRVTSQVKITDPTNPQNYVVVNQITALKFLDKQSGQTWVWQQ